MTKHAEAQQKLLDQEKEMVKKRNSRQMAEAEKALRAQEKQVFVNFVSACSSGT